MSTILNPLARIASSLLAFYYKLVPSYGGAIILLTVSIMVVLVPLNLKAMRSQLAMANLAPKLKKLKDKYPNPADRQLLNQEMMAMYKDEGVSPVGGCLPLFLQLPVIVGLYRAVYGLRGVGQKAANCIDAEPQFVSKSSKLFRDLIADRIVKNTTGKCSAGQTTHQVIEMKSLGLDLAHSVHTAGNGFAKGPYVLLVLAMVGLQYLQQWQVTRRANPNQNTNPTMLIVMKIFPVLYGVVALFMPYFSAAIVLYLVASSSFRITQQALIFRFDPVVRKHHNARREAEVIAAKSSEKKSGSKQSPKSKDSGAVNGGKGSSKGGALQTKERPSAEQPKDAPTPKRNAQRRAKGGR